jgi:hypothetical protein
VSDNTFEMFKIEDLDFSPLHKIIEDALTGPNAVTIYPLNISLLMQIV